MNKEFKLFKKQSYENDDSAIKLLNKCNVLSNEIDRLREQYKLYDDIIDKAVNDLIVMQDDEGSIITDNQIEDVIMFEVKEHMKQLISEVEKGL